MITQTKHHALWIIWTLNYVVCLGALASPDKNPTAPSPPVTPQPPASPSVPVVYKPPKRGAPATRIGGGTRGGDTQLILNVLASVDTGWTSKAQPVLYWSISASTAIEHELILNDDRSIKPLLAIRSREPIAAGIHAWRLADHQIHLQAGIEYEWSVSLIHDPQQPSRSTVASATLSYVKASAELAAQVTKASPSVAASLWADHGYWYDAMESLSEPLRQSSNHPLLKQYRSALLSQVGLAGVAVQGQP